MRRVEEVARCTHLVVERRVVRTEKFLCAMAYGIPVVTRQWIIDSTAQGKVLRKLSGRLASLLVLTTTSNRKLSTCQRFGVQENDWLRYRRSPSACKSDRENPFQGPYVLYQQTRQVQLSAVGKSYQGIGWAGESLNSHHHLLYTDSLHLLGPQYASAPPFC